MPISKTQTEITERIVELLVQSPLDENLKEFIIEKIDMLSESMITDLLEALETENNQLQIIAAKIEEYINNQENGWEDVEVEQKSFAEKFLEDAAQHLDDQAMIQELKDSI